jgi:hypothetical protein
MTDRIDPTTTDQHTMQDPTAMYSDFDAEVQYQEGAGLDSAMRDRADLGERTYRGSGRLTGRRALITGGDSGIGGATAIAFAREGADVALSYLPEECCCRVTSWTAPPATSWWPPRCASSAASTCW